MALKFSSKFLGAVPRNDLDGIAVTPADGTDLPAAPPGTVLVGLYATGTGNINVNLKGGGTAVLTGLAAGQAVGVEVTRVLATSTTATGIFALYAPLGV